jgi:hypothetical protein
MARYRKIDPRIYNDAKFKALSERGKLLFFTIPTHPHMTALGAMRAAEAGLCQEMTLGASTKGAVCPVNRVFHLPPPQHACKRVEIPSGIKPTKGELSHE